MRKVVFIGQRDSAIEFAINKVAVKSFLRNGLRVNGFVRKVKAGQAAKKAIDDLDPKIVENFVTKGDLPSRGELALSLSKNPIQKIQEGFRRERDMMRMIENFSGKKVTRGDVIKAGLQVGTNNIKDMVKDPTTKKELTVNLGGFMGSLAGKSTGVPGAGVALDLGGARLTRKVLDDTTNLKQTLRNLQAKPSYNEASRQDKIGQIFNESKRLKEASKKQDTIALAGDTAGWFGGNFLPVPVPMGGLISGVTSGKLAESISSMIPPKTFEEAIATVLSSQLRKGNRREEKIREEIKEQWLKIQNQKTTNL